MKEKQKKIELLKGEERNYKEIIKKATEIKWKYLHDLDELKNSNIDIICTICGHSESRTIFPKINSECIFQGGKIERYECPSCGLVFGSIIFLSLTEEESSNDYRMLYSLYSEGDTTEYEIKTFYSLNPTKEGVYLNFGAGRWSKSLKTLREQGYNIYGYEPYSGEIDLEYMITNIDDLKNRKFDGVISHNLIEHLFNPLESFELFKSLLKDKNSLMAHSTPCYNYKYEFTRFHVHFYTGKSINVICDKLDLKVLEKQYDDSVEYINCVFSNK